MPGTISLHEFRRQGGRISVNDDFVTSSIDMSELEYFIQNTQKQKVPQSFFVKGIEKTVLVKLTAVELRGHGEDEEIDMWIYESTDTVLTKEGPRAVAITVFND